MPIKVFLADDHALIIGGIRAILERTGKDVQIVGEAANGKAVLEKCKTIVPDVFVLDIAMPIMNGLETAIELIRRNKNARVIMLSMHDSRVFVEKAMKAGVRGYVIKESATEEILQAIREVAAGRYYLSPRISQYVVQGFVSPRQSRDVAAGAAVLTASERRVLQLLAEGMATKEIARELAISESTAAVHRKNIMKKLGVHKQTELIRYAIKEGIVSV